MVMPGPIVDDIVTLLRYLPFAADGLALTTLSTSACAFSIRLCAANDDLADRGVDDAGLVDAELDLAGLDFAHRLGDVHRDGAGLRVRHQPARAEHLAELADRAHHVGRRDDGVEVHEAALDLVDHLFAADVIRAGLGGFALLVAAGDGQDLLALAQPVRQHDGAADHLVGVLRIDAKAHRQLDGLVELGELHLLHQGNGFFDRVRTLRHCCPRGRKLLSGFSHVPTSVVQTASVAGLPRLSLPTSGIRLLVTSSWPKLVAGSWTTR